MEFVQFEEHHLYSNVMMCIVEEHESVLLARSCSVSAVEYSRHCSSAVKLLFLYNWRILRKRDSGTNDVSHWSGTSVGYFCTLTPFKVPWMS